MGDAYQIRDQEMPYFLTFQVVVAWADVFTRKCISAKLHVAKFVTDLI
jgi:hypothetical protein